jgi:acyl-CoA thioesterase-1
MMRIECLSMVLLGLTASACQTVEPKAPTVAYFGDSTIYGMNPKDHKNQIQRNAPHVLESELKLRCGAPVTVQNYGKGGATASELLYGSTRYPGGFKQVLASSNAQYAIVNYGINDSSREVPIAKYKAQLAAFHQIASAAGVTLIYETPNPVVLEKLRLPAILRDGLPAKVAAMEEVALEKHVPLVDQFHYLSKMPNLAELMPDGVHPTEQALAIKAKRVADILAPIICQ